MMKLDHSISSSDKINDTSLETNAQFLPNEVAEVPKELLKNYPHTKRVGNYLLGKTLGEGSFAKVKEGVHSLTGEKVAIKVIDKKKAKEDAYVRKNLRREGKLLQVIRHKHVVQLFEIMETENSYYLVTELCEGGDLMDHICNKKRLEEKESKKYIRQIISAVDYLHKAGILHRDLKVENLLLDSTQDIKIIDFGLSNSVRVSQNKEGGTTIEEFCVTQCGSPAYAAPELLGNKKYGPKVDIWSIGVNMYAMLTGNLPFTVEPFNIKALHNKMLKGEMNPIPDHLTKSCKELLKRFLTPEVDHRITLQEAMLHPWITEGRNKPVEPAPFPNKLSADDLDHSVVKHMATHMEFKSLGDIIRLVTGGLPNTATATYHLLLKKLQRYTTETKPRKKTTQGKLVSNSNISENTSFPTSETIDSRSENKQKTVQPYKPVKRTHGNTQHTSPQENGQSKADAESMAKPNNYTKNPVVPSRKDDDAKQNNNNKQMDLDPDSLDEFQLNLGGGETNGNGEHEMPTIEMEEKKVEVDMKFFHSTRDQGTPRRPDPIHPTKQATVCSEKSPPEHNTNEVYHIPLFTRNHPHKPQTEPVDLPAIATPRHVATAHPSSKDSPRFQSDKIRRFSEAGNHVEQKQSAGEEIQCGVAPARPKTFAPNNKSGAAENSSQSTTSSNDHRSTCSNPTNPKQLTKTTVDNAGCISDPSTKKERKTAFTRPAAKKVVIDVGHYEKYARDRNGNIVVGSSLHKTFPSVSPLTPQDLSHVGTPRRLLNLIYPSTVSPKTKFNSPRQVPVTIRNRPFFARDNTLNVTGEKAGFGNGRLTSIVRNSVEHSFTPRYNFHQEDDQMMELHLGESHCENENGGLTRRGNSRDEKVALPMLSPPTSQRNHHFL